MEKKDIVQLLSQIFIPLGYKRKGNSWVINGDELSKIVNLQQSNYGVFFYINYGFIIKNLELTTKTHVDERLGSMDKQEQKIITDLLDLEIEMDDVTRLAMLNKFISDKIVPLMQSVNTEEELRDYLMSWHHLYGIPLIVKKHFGLSSEDKPK